MTLEDIVPPMELCKQIPTGKFDDSALVWRGKNQTWWDKGLYPRECGHCSEFDSGEIIAPAPTLQEIIDDLTKEELCPGLEALRKANGELVYSVYASDKMKQGSAAEAALKLWLELV